MQEKHKGKHQHRQIRSSRALDRRFTHSSPRLSYNRVQLECCIRSYSTGSVSSNSPGAGDLGSRPGCSLINRVD